MDLNMIKKITGASGVSAGELILIHFWGEDAEKTIANQFMEAVASFGATPMLLQQSRTVNRDIFVAADERCFDRRYFDLLSNFDAVLDVFAYRPVILGCEIGEEKTGLYRSYMARLFSVLMNCKRFTQIRIPTAANAEESGLAAGEYISRMTRAYDVEYSVIKAACGERAEKLGRTDRLVLQTGTDCRLRFDLSGRAWQIDAGDGDFPCGEVYIAPVEGATNGEVFFEKLYLEDAGVFEHVTLSVENGRISGSDQESVNGFLRGLSEESRVVCELGFGMNPNVSDLCGYTVLDEKMAGSFHIAIGANTMFGGKNDAPVHMDFVGAGQILL